jgi:hypothetical protein
MKHIAPALLLLACHHESPPAVQPPGQPRTAETKALETGAHTLQTLAPTRAFDMYLDGFHVMKDDHSMMMEAHHSKKKLNSYGKTWHVWDSEHSQLPVGEAKLAWSFNHDGEFPPQLIEQRDKRLHVDTQAKRRERADLAPDARPQQGEGLLQSSR